MEHLPVIQEYSELAVGCQVFGKKIHPVPEPDQEKILGQSAPHETEGDGGQNCKDYYADGQPLLKIEIIHEKKPSCHG